MEEIVRMNSKDEIDLSPKIFNIVCIMSIIAIIIHIITDIIYVGKIDYMTIIPVIILFFWSENNKGESPTTRT